MGITRRGSTPLKPTRIEPNMAHIHGKFSVVIEIHDGNISKMIS